MCTKTVTTIVALVAALVAVHPIACGAQAKSDPSSSYRLPRDTKPLAYGLRLVPKYDKGSDLYTFGGQVEILIYINCITPNVTLNAKDMQIQSVAITELKTQKDQVVDSYELDNDAEILYIYAQNNLLPYRRYQVKIVFQGLLRTDMTGFYRSMYKENNVTKWMAVTQFKPAYARRAFPCYDEPEYKTPFNISLGKRMNQMTLSNMPIYFTQDLGYYGWYADLYETTPPIPTYLVGALVGNLKKSHAIEGSDVNVYTYNDYLNQVLYVTEETPTLFETMQNYTDSSNELKKMDFISIPDFDGDGMENWGINTYREKYMLFDDDAKMKFKEQSQMVIQNLNNHQWFGNMVTCAWWDYLWLSDGFARYFQYFALEMVNQDWRLEELFVVEQHQTAMEFDQTPRHPITTSIKTSDDIQNIFKGVICNKAAAVLRMLKCIVTEYNFQEPLKLYLKNFKNGAVTPSNLWAVYENYYFEIEYSLSENVQFTNFIQSWTDQSGYPVVNVTRNQNTYIITQKKFSVWPSDDNTTSWYIGLTYTNNLARNFEDLRPVRWLKPYTSVMYLRDSSLCTWVIFNLQSTGFYRVNYDLNNWQQLIKQLNESNTNIHVLNRAQLIDDSFNLARAGMLHYSVALNLSTYLMKEDDEIPWYTAIECLSYVVERMRRSAEGYDYIKSYVRKLADYVYRKTETLVVQHYNDDHTTITSWNKFSVWACYLDGEYCTNNAMLNFQKWTNRERISPDIKDAALCTGIKVSNNVDTWKGVLNVYMTTKSASEKNSAQAALACSQDTMTLYKYLEFLFDSNTGGPVRLQDFKDICDAMSLTPQGIEALTNFLMNNIERILRQIPTGESIVTYMYRILASKVALDIEIAKLTNLKNAAGLPPKIKASFDESYLQVEQNLLWYKGYHTTINQWTGAPLDPTTSEPVTTVSSSDTTVSSSSTTVSSSSTTVSSSDTTVSSSNTTVSLSNTTVTSSNTTASSTVPGVTQTMPPQTAYPTFDFDNQTLGPIIISKCPDKSGQSSCQSNLYFVIIVVTTATIMVVL
ncbi:glutamyl aminopeptidase-like [Metopolophium dirhodum]|uniref:glutamyl aminopeptidase-like n=1 Tax=Metopolophium dirhodum TaxID=44670 RepID=UPI00299064BB|nr:glutamyl aminopeptidase-like [Metopolophium dirhodum]